MAEVLNVEVRQTRGKRNARRMRATGMIPVVLYGHGEETISLTVSAEQLDSAVRHGSRMVNLAGAVNEMALISELQWNTWGTGVLHADFTRVSEHEKVTTQVTVELRGEAPGVREGGVVEQLIHQVQLECKATDIPDKLTVSVNTLKLYDTITVADFELPADGVVLAKADAVVVQCVEPAKELDEEGADAVEGEPEIIGGRKEDEEGAEG